MSSLNAQIPPIWNLFLDEWKKDDYQYVQDRSNLLHYLTSLLFLLLLFHSGSSAAVRKRARFLYLFATFIRSIQFLTTVGYTMDVLYDLFDRTLLVAKQALKGIQIDLYVVFTIFTNIRMTLTSARI